MIERALKEGYARGEMQGRHIIGEVTEALHKFLIDGWDQEALGPPPRIEEDLSFVPKDREEVVYVYMYRVAQNTALRNNKRHRVARFSITDLEELAEAQKEQAEGRDVDVPEVDQIYWERPPLYLDLHYLVGVHSKFRSDAERLLGWVLLRLHEATHLVYRPRRYLLPDGRAVDSTGKPWSLENEGDDVIMERVSLALTDELTVGDAINFFTIHEAPYRPYVTYQARCAMEGALVASSSAEQPQVAPPEFVPKARPDSRTSSSGRTASSGRFDTKPRRPGGSD